MDRVITWVDLQGRYRITHPAYNDATRPAGETEDECLARVWARLVAHGGYGIPSDHPRHYVERADLWAKWNACCGSDFRYAGKPDVNGGRSAIDGAWEMDTDGTPRVNMPKARGVHMDKIRVARNAELVNKDLISLRAIEAGDTSAQATIASEKQVLRDIPQTFDLTTNTAEELKQKWPEGLPRSN